MRDVSMLRVVPSVDIWNEVEDLLVAIHWAVVGNRWRTLHDIDPRLLIWKDWAADKNKTTRTNIIDTEYPIAEDIVPVKKEGIDWLQEKKPLWKWRSLGHKWQVIMHDNSITLLTEERSHREWEGTGCPCVLIRSGTHTNTRKISGSSMFS